MMKGKEWFWSVCAGLCAGVWFGAITYWSCLETTATPLYGVPDYIRHGCVFGLLAFFVFMSVYRWIAPISATLLLVAFAGFIDEVHQAFVPTRGFDPWDWLADIVGASIVVFGLVLANNLVTRFWKMNWKAQA